MFKVVLLIAAFCATPALAVELRDATNTQLLDELARRLNNGGGGGGGTRFNASASCDGGDLEVSIYDENFQRVGFLDDYYGSAANCATMLTALPFGANGYVTAGQQIGYCDHSDLTVYGVMPNGTLKELSDTYQGSQQACWDAMRRFNEQRRH